MTTIEAIDAIYQGSPVECSKFEYELGLREAILKQAAKWIDTKQDIRAVIALNEVKRLDARFGTMMIDRPRGHAMLRFKSGQPCSLGCQGHVTHPCEKCGRIACQGDVYEPFL